MTFALMKFELLIVIVDVVMSSLVPDPPVPEKGTFRGTLGDGMGPIRFWGTGVLTYERIGELMALPLPSSGWMM